MFFFDYTGYYFNKSFIVKIAAAQIVNKYRRVIRASDWTFLRLKILAALALINLVTIILFAEVSLFFLILSKLTRVLSV